MHSKLCPSPSRACGQELCHESTGYNKLYTVIPAVVAASDGSVADGLFPYSKQKKTTADVYAIDLTGLTSSTTLLFYGNDGTTKTLRR